MQVRVEEVSSLTRRIDVTLPREMVAGELNAAYEKLKGEVNLKGFRKGKVPRKVLEKNYGPKVEYDVADRLVQESYFDALEKAGLDAVVHPEVREHRFEDDGTFFYQAEIDVRPDFTLGEYKKVEVEQPELEVGDEEVAAELEKLRRESAPLRAVEDRVIADGDLAVIDFTAYDQGEEMKHVGGRDFTVDVGSGQIGPEFEDSLKGLKAGEESTFTVDFPANFPNMLLAGKSIEFAVKVKEVKERVLPELDDEFAKDIDADLATLDDLRGQIREKLRQQKENAGRGDLVDRVMKAILDNHDFEVPPRLVAHEVDAMIKELENNLQNRGLSLEEAGINRDSLIEKYREGAEKRVRGDFILKKIAEVEEIKVADEDISKGFQRIADQYNMPVEEVKKYFHSRNELMPFIHELLTEKILDFLVAEAKIKTVPADQVEAAPETADNPEKEA
ncbi:trigger factor [Desulfurivibrio alkaliphilus]|uniref:Trigger factor n=1 Tax=Desulfurivibrio alkaliphilus (strain DSM 19089 / UNIQEM U267 / AHT2) TaxID=589865 RepID=D6Z374_DESAT|nr:trigger factor [Desulfurivibrio alkaliphilus]ADH85999.1 trigger factor [Desulfurivibrio alkaliphilus AHT 2]